MRERILAQANLVPVPGPTSLRHAYIQQLRGELPPGLSLSTACLAPLASAIEGLCSSLDWSDPPVMTELL